MKTLTDLIQATRQVAPIAMCEYGYAGLSNKDIAELMEAAGVATEFDSKTFNRIVGNLVALEVSLRKRGA